jgi:serine/threonine protein kinase
MVFNQFPFNGSDPNVIKDRIINAEFKIPNEYACTEELIDILKCMLHKDPNQRDTLMQIRNHKWMCLSDSAI